MARFTRAEFLRLAALSAGALGARGLPRLSAQPPTGSARVADLAVVNARIFTVDDTLPRAEALAVKGDRFLAVGTSSDIRNLVGAGTRVIDAGGITVVPGFIDAHCHPSGVNELFGVNTNLTKKREIVAALQKKASATPPGFWVEGFMYDDTKVDDGPVTRSDLDFVSRDHPVAVNHRGGHTSVYNSKAFNLAGVTRSTPDPAGGRFERDASGELTGKVAEDARQVLNRAGRREEFTAAERRQRARDGLRHISQLMTAAGLTSVHDAGANVAKLQTYEEAHKAGDLRHRAYVMTRGLEALNELKGKGVRTGSGNEWVRVGGIKFVADGSASERTMYMSTPYEGRSDRGILTMTQAEIHEAVEQAHRAGFQVGIHANGDVAIDMVLQAYERVLQKWPRADPRHRIEHCTLVNPDLLKRIKATGSIPTPFWTYVYYHGEKWTEYGEQRTAWMFAHRSFLDSGIRVPGASDYTPGPFEPMMAIQSMVTRKDYAGRLWGANQRVTVDEAIRIGTLNGAYASAEETLKGSITAGKLADFVMLDKDPHDVDADSIKDIRVVRTVVGGRTMHPSPE
jgi:predicted amidohydrolase YtcJ